MATDQKPITRPQLLMLAGTITLLVLLVGGLLWATTRHTVIDATTPELLKATITQAEQELTPPERRKFRKALYIHAYPMRLEASSLEDVLKLPPPTPPQLVTVHGKPASEIIAEAEQLYEMAHRIRLLGLEQELRSLELKIETIKGYTAKLSPLAPYKPPRMVAINNGAMTSAQLRFDYANRSVDAVQSVILVWRMKAPGAEGNVASGTIRREFPDPLLPGAMVEIEESIYGFTAQDVAKHLSPETAVEVETVRAEWADGSTTDLAEVWADMPDDPVAALEGLREAHEKLRLQVPIL